MIRFVLLICVSLIIINIYDVECEKSRYADSRPSLFDWIFGENTGRQKPYRRPSRRRNWKKVEYTKLTVNRKMFYYWDSTYKPWSNWTTCHPVKCVKTRYRECIDNTWKEYVQNFKQQIKCPVKFIYERKQCNDTIECQPIKVNMTNVNVSSSSLPENCGLRKQRLMNKIIGGTPSVPNSWPWHAGIYVTSRYRSQYICGATLINSGWLLTAAHCFLSLRTMDKLPIGKIINTKRYGFFNSFKVVMGDHDRRLPSKYEITSRISYMIFHPEFIADYSANLYDVALIKLEENVVPTEQIGFACLPQMSSNFTVKTGQMCYAVGWGNTRTRDPFGIWNYEFSGLFDSMKKLQRNRRYQRKQLSASLLQEVELPIVDFDKCRRQYRIFNLNKKIHVCAGSRKKDTCSGDSGGGLFCKNSNDGRWELTGITNFGSARGCGNSYGVYMRTTAISEWIQNIIKKAV